MFRGLTGAYLSFLYRSKVATVTTQHIFHESSCNIFHIHVSSRKYILFWGVFHDPVTGDESDKWTEFGRIGAAEF